MAVTEEAFDVEAAIRDFLADPTRSAMELPQMTTGQRKHARTLAEEHPGLKCESFGLAEERRMHLFKVAIQQAVAKEAQQQQGEGLGMAGLEALIRDFVADPSRTLLDLPQLTTEQRKQARKVAEQFPNITCESFGLGADRRLHLFKEGPPLGGGGHLAAPADAKGAAAGATAAAEAPADAAPAPCAFSVKNTFIDDWAAGGVPEPIVFRSCPLRLPAGLGLNLGLDEAAHEGAAAATPKREEDGATSVACTADLSRAGDLSPGASTCASGGGWPGARTPSDRSSKAAALPLPEGLQVRNTFLCGAVPGEPGDDRIVRSMPHGMFSQRLLEELLSEPGSPSAATTVAAACPQAPAPAPPLATTPPPAPPVATQPPSTPEAQRTLEPGTEVIIDGLTKLPDYNGLRCTVQAFDAQAGRYDVLLPVAVGPTSRRWAKVKRENLRVARPPQPPCFEPSVSAAAQPPARDEPWEALGLQTWSAWEDLGSMLSPLAAPAAHA